MKAADFVYTEVYKACLSGGVPDGIAANHATAEEIGLTGRRYYHNPELSPAWNGSWEIIYS